MGLIATGLVQCPDTSLVAHPMARKWVITAMGFSHLELGLIHLVG